MAALSADRKIKTSGVRRTFVGAVKGATKIYSGALVSKTAAGYVVPASDVAAQKVVGVALAQADNTDGADGAITVPLGTGVFEFDNAGGAIVQASAHALCYVNDDNSVTTAAVAANDCVAGLVDGFTTTKVLVDVDPVYAA